jgi:hypothetical protein
MVILATIFSFSTTSSDESQSNFSLWSVGIYEKVNGPTVDLYSKWNSGTGLAFEVSRKFLTNSQFQFALSYEIGFQQRKGVELVSGKSNFWFSGVRVMAQYPLGWSFSLDTAFSFGLGKFSYKGPEFTYTEGKLREVFQFELGPSYYFSELDFGLYLRAGREFILSEENNMSNYSYFVKFGQTLWF